MAIARRVVVGALLVGASVGIGTLGAPSAGAGTGGCPPEVEAQSTPGDCDALAVPTTFAAVGTEIPIDAVLECNPFGDATPADSIVTIAIWEDTDLPRDGGPDIGPAGEPDLVLDQVASGEAFSGSYVVQEAPSEGTHVVGAFCGAQGEGSRSHYTTVSVDEASSPPVSASDPSGSGLSGDSIEIEPATGEPGDSVTVTPFEVGCGAGDPRLVFFPDYPDTSNVVDIDTFQNGATGQDFDFDVPDDANDPSAFATYCPDGSLHWTQPWGTEVLAGIPLGAASGADLDFDLPHDRSSFTRSLATPDDVDLGPEHVATNLIVALLLLLLVFPAEVFNATFEENYDEVTRWLRGPRNLLEKATAWLAGRGTAVGFAVVAAIASLLYAFLDPDVGFDQASLALVVGIGASLVVGVLVAAAAARRYVSSKSEDQGRLRVYPAALFVALVCVLISRIVDFQPGYLYGVIAGIAFTVELSKEDDGRAAAQGAVVALALAFVSWLLWVPVQDMANDANPSLPILILDAFLAAIFVGGVQGVVFGFVPMRFLPGSKVWAWSRKTWLIIEGVAAFAFVQILIHPAEAYDGNLNKMIVLFLGFAALSFGFWGYFRNRAVKEEAAVGAGSPAAEPPPAEPPADPPDEA